MMGTHWEQEKYKSLEPPSNLKMSLPRSWCLKLVAKKSLLRSWWLKLVAKNVITRSWGFVGYLLVVIGRFGKG
jgi:hypothetical protein